MKQPALGIVSTILIMGISLGFISLWDFQTFAGWVSFVVMSTIPMQLVIVVAWGTNQPGFAASLSQPAKGFVLLLINLAVGFVCGGLYHWVVGGRISPPAPMLVVCTIVSVVIMFWFAIMFGSWPFNKLIANPVGAGLAMLVACYVVNYLLFRLFFDFSFMQGAPVYAAKLDPQGLFNANYALVFYVTALGFLFLLLHFDLWPLTKSPGLMKQPVLGIVWTILALVLAGLLFYVGVVAMKMDPLGFMIRVPVPFIFGTIVVLNMLHGSLYAKMTQPLKGVMNAFTAAIVGTVLALMYGALAPVVTGVLAPGPPGNDFERWLASALLGVTFPFLIIFAEFFKMWPLKKV